MGLSFAITLTTPWEAEAGWEVFLRSSLGVQVLPSSSLEISSMGRLGMCSVGSSLGMCSVRHLETREKIRRSQKRTRPRGKAL